MSGPALCQHVAATLAIVISFGGLGCGGGREAENGGKESNAAAVAEQMLDRMYPGERYRSFCETRLRDGYILTLFAPGRDDVKLGHEDVPLYPIVAVPDHGEPREVKPIGVISDKAVDSSNKKQTALDSAAKLGVARRALPGTARLHCYIPFRAGALVEFIAPGSSSAAKPMGGIVVGVSHGGSAGIVARF